MHGYEKFFDDVTDAFQEIIASKKPVVKCFSDQTFGNYSVRLEFPKSVLIFDLDRMDLQVCFADKSESDEKYHINDIVEVLYPIDAVTEFNTENGSREMVIQQLHFFYKLVRDYLENVIDGDFSWSNLYKVRAEESRSRIAKVLQLEYNHSIYQKFRVGDNSWKEDIDKLS
jgi:hypothetical protein